jgi:hypothetical protein
MSEPTSEYLFAKAELCYKLAQKQLEEMRISRKQLRISREQTELWLGSLT